MLAPITRGINNKNENLKAFSLSIPENKPADIVIPDLETPGKRASTCNKPMNNEFFQFSFLPSLANLVKKRIIEVKIKKIPINKKEEKIDSTNGLNKKPKRAAGMVAIIR